MAKKIELEYDGSIRVTIDGVFHGWIYNRQGKLSFASFEGYQSAVDSDDLRLVADQMDALTKENPPEVKRGWLASLLCNG